MNAIRTRIVSDTFKLFTIQQNIADVLYEDAQYPCGVAQGFFF